MSIANHRVVAGRIKAATEESPIGVLASIAIGMDGRPLFNAVFAATVGGQRVIRGAGRQLLGIYHGVDGAADFLLDIMQPEGVPGRTIRQRQSVSQFAMEQA